MLWAVHYNVFCLFSWQYEYFNAVLINELDEEGNSVDLGGEFILQPNEHFNNLSVNLSLSVVQVPTNMYNKGTHGFTSPHVNFVNVFVTNNKENK